MATKSAWGEILSDVRYRLQCGGRLKNANARWNPAGVASLYDILWDLTERASDQKMESRDWRAEFRIACSSLYLAKIFELDLVICGERAMAMDRFVGDLMSAVDRYSENLKY